MAIRIRLLAALLLALSLGGCDLAAGVFQAGFWVGALVVIVILVLVVWAVFQLFD